MGIYIGSNKYTGGPADPSSTMIAKSIGTTQGDMIYFTGASTPVRLPKGTAGQVLTMNSGATAPIWQTPSGGGGSSTLGGLSDVTLTSTASGNALLYNGSSWINGSISSGSSTLGGLSDTNITSPANLQALIYNSSTSKWINQMILWDQNMNSFLADEQSAADGSDPNDPWICAFIYDNSRRNFLDVGSNHSIVCETGAGPNGEDVFHMGFSAIATNYENSIVDNYLCIRNNTGTPVIIDVVELRCDFSSGVDPADHQLVQDINQSPWPAIEDSEYAILCYTAGYDFAGDSWGIVSWGGNFRSLI